MADAELDYVAPAHLLSVRCSLRLLSVARLIERRIDRLMRAQFGATISRFDFLAALDRHGPLTLGEISEKLLVSNGNITGLTSRMREDGLIETRAHVSDRRAQEVRLTADGRRLFRRMAEAHAACVSDLLRELGGGDMGALARLLDAVKGSVRRKLEQESAQ